MHVKWVNKTMYDIMNKLQILIVILCCLLLTSCSSPDKHLFIICYQDSAGTTIVYDQNRVQYELKDNVYYRNDVEGYIKEPAIMYVPTHSKYSLSCNFVGNYTSTLENSFAYVTALCDTGYKITSYTYTPNMCTLHLAGVDKMVFYITRDTMRVYSCHT